jgi:hypothetical protein
VAWLKIKCVKPDVMVHSYSPSTWETEAGESRSCLKRKEKEKEKIHIYMHIYTCIYIYSVMTIHINMLLHYCVQN